MRGAIIVLTCAVLAGCAGMLNGSMTDVSTGQKWPFEIQRSRGTGDLRATNPSTGETFTGQYTAVGGNAGGVAYMPNNTVQPVGGAVRSPYGSTAVFTPPSTANARGVLTGTSGTVIQVYLEIQPGLKPRGVGEAVDNKGNRFMVQF